MAKKLLILVLVLVVAGAAYFGVVWYQANHLSADKTLATFIDQTIAGDATKTYGRFTPNLKKQISTTEWDKYLTFYKHYNGEPKLENHEHIKDSFNTYPKNSDPQRYTYIFTFKDQAYQMVIVTYKQGGLWKIDELQGNYR